MIDVNDSQNSSSEVMVSVNNITKKYIPFFSKLFKKESSKTVVAVKDVSFDIKKGEIFGLIGSNGAGKTTILKLICGLNFPDEGKIEINNIDISKNFEAAVSNIGALIEEPTLYPDLTGLDNLKYFASIQGANITDQRIKDIVELVGLTDRIKTPFKTYSLGMKQRLGIAQAIMHNPALLILDEPTNGLDPDGIIQMRNLLKQLSHEMNTTIIISSHILSEIQNICDKFCFMDKGEVLAIKTLEEIESVGDEIVTAYTIDNLDLAKELVLSKFADVVKVKIKDGIFYIKSAEKYVSEVTKEFVTAGISIKSIVSKKKTVEDYYKELRHNEK